MSLKRRLKEAYSRRCAKCSNSGNSSVLTFCRDTFTRRFPISARCEKRTEWRLPYSMLGVSGADIESQLDFVKSCCTPAMQELLRKNNIHALASERNGEEGFGPIEADFLYGICRHDLGNIRNYNKGIELSRVDFKGFANAE